MSKSADVCCTVRHFKTPKTDVVSDELAASLSQWDIRCVHPSVSASLGAVTSRRVKDEISAARKLELVINSSVDVLSSCILPVIRET